MAQSQVAVLDAAGASVDFATILIGGVHRVQHVVTKIGKIGEFFRRHLDTIGDGTGTKNAVGDYSSTATDFKLRPAGGTVFVVERVVILLGDSATFVNDGYGAAAALTNGILVEKYDHGGSSVITSIHDGLAVKTNFDWARFAGNDVSVEYAGTNKHRVWDWRPPAPIRLDGTLNQELRFRLNDDFSVLTEHYFAAEGFKETVQV